MVVLNFYGKIEPICISEKLKLYISKLPEEEHNEWRTELVEQLILSNKVNDLVFEKMNPENKEVLIELYSKVFPSKSRVEMIDERKLEEGSKNICRWGLQWQINRCRKKEI